VVLQVDQQDVAAGTDRLVVIRATGN